MAVEGVDRSTSGVVGTGVEASLTTAADVARWRGGDPAAFRALHRRFTPLLRARVVHSPAWPLLAAQLDVDDVVQEVWLRAIPPAQSSFEPVGPGSFLAFVGRIADRTIIDLARSVGSRKRGRGRGAATLDTAAERAAALRPGQAVEPTPTGVARHTEMLAIARRELAAREYEAWDLVELRGYTADEAGLAMRCSGAAVRGLLLRSRAKLVRRLGRATDGE